MQIDVGRRTKTIFNNNTPNSTFVAFPNTIVSHLLSVERGTLIHQVIAWQAVQVAQMEQEVALGLAIAEELVALRVLGEGQQMWL